MDRKLAGLLGAAAALTTMHSAQASPAQPAENVPAASYRDLLDPIPNALTLLKADDARLAETPAAGMTQLAQYHHHHHHHHHGARGVVIRLGPGRVHRHHHHHHHSYHHHHHHHRHNGY